ncbi:MAG: ABC transporter permease, partial [bacterium]
MELSQPRGILDQWSDLFWRKKAVLLFLLLAPPLLWLGFVYIGSLLALLLQSFFSIDEFSGLVNYEFTLKTYGELFLPANYDIILRTFLMAASVSIAAAVIAFPIAYYAARYARGKMKAFFYLAVMMPLWSSYLVKDYAWKFILNNNGLLNTIL